MLAGLAEAHGVVRAGETCAVVKRQGDGIKLVLGPGADDEAAEVRVRRHKLAGADCYLVELIFWGAVRVNGVRCGAGAVEGLRRQR